MQRRFIVRYDSASVGATMTNDEIMAQLRELGKRFEDPKIQRRFKEFNKTLQFVFPDIDMQIYMRIGDAELLEVNEGTTDAEMTVTMDSTVFFKIMDKSESPMAAYQAGKLKTKGEVPDLLKLQKLML
ncbi:MAG: SCP2 sterol-binding domain-containing protein [Candidatus Hermodarchaeota archaeon]